MRDFPEGTSNFHKSPTLPESERLENYEKYKLLLYKVHEKKVEEYWSNLETNDFEPILIKGWSAARYYPKPYLRQIGDVDIAVNPKRYEAALRFKHNWADGGGEVDLHKGLRHLDKLEWENIFENSQLINCGGEPVRVLRREDHLRVLCVHWLTDGGINKEKLWDIYHAIESRPPGFDWDRFLNATGDKRRRWFLSAVGATHKYLGLDIELTPIAEEAKKMPGWLIDTIEKEWACEVKFQYLESSLGSKKEFFNQIKKRFPPNPIQSTVNMEGDFDNKPRIIYQIPDAILRLSHSLKKNQNNFLRHFWRGGKKK